MENEDRADFDGPLSFEAVSLAAKLFDLKFPNAFTEFFTSFGVGAFGATEFFGLIADNIPANSVPFVVFATLTERKM